MADDAKGGTWMAGVLQGLGDCVFEMRQGKNSPEVRHVLRVAYTTDGRGEIQVNAGPWALVLAGALGRDQWFAIDKARIGPVGMCSEAVVRIAKAKMGIQDVVAVQESALNLLDQARAEAAAKGKA